MKLRGDSPLRIGELSRRLGPATMCSGPARIATACCSRCARQAASGCTPRRTSGGPPLAASAGDRLSAALRQALDAFDEPAVLPYLADLGERWQRGTASVAMEHFANNVICGRLAGLAGGWRRGHGPQALLACPPLAGAGATAQIATAAEARLIAGDPVTEAERAGWSR